MRWKIDNALRVFSFYPLYLWGLRYLRCVQRQRMRLKDITSQYVCKQVISRSIVLLEYFFLGITTAFVVECIGYPNI